MSAVAERLRRAAERMAADAFDERVEELVRLAEGDLDGLHEAMQAVQSKASAAGTPEHIAFTLLAATWRRTADDARARAHRPSDRHRSGTSNQIRGGETSSS